MSARDSLPLPADIIVIDEKSLPSRIVSWLAMFFVLLVASIVGAATGLAICDWSEESKAARIGFISVFAVWTLLDVPYIFRVARAGLRHEHSIVFTAACEQKMTPVPIRPLIAAWWLGHFAIVIGFVLAMRQGPQTDERALVAFMAACFGWAGNGFLIQAVATLTRNDRIRLRVWKLRWLADLGLGALAYFLR